MTTILRFLFLMITCMSGLSLAVPQLHAADKKVVLGVNAVGVNQLSEPQQDALIQQLRQDGVRAVRTGFGEDFRYSITHAYQNGIGAVVILDPLHGSKGPLRPADPSLGLTWRQQALSDANPAAFSKWLVPQLAALEASEVRLTAMELGNEVNSAGYNGDFIPAQTTARLLGLADLTNPNDPEGRAIARGYLAYLKVMAALKDARDHSRLNRQTPVISAGLASAGLPGKKRDGSSTV